MKKPGSRIEQLKKKAHLAMENLTDRAHSARDKVADQAHVVVDAAADRGRDAARKTSRRVGNTLEDARKKLEKLGR